MGHLSLIIGCMFAQKTTELLRRIRKFESIGYRVLVINYSKDNRYGSNIIASHDVVTRDAVCIDKLAMIDKEVRSSHYDVVVVDEGQFFEDLYKYVTDWTDNLNIQVVIAGLDGDSNRQPFGDILKLIPFAEEVDRQTAFCAVCRDGTLAMYSKFTANCAKTISTISSQVVVGGAELYKPVCRKHYLS